MATTAEEVMSTETAQMPVDGALRTVVASKYEVELDHQLGAGGMAIVYRGRDLRTRRTIALKTLRPELRGDPETRARFRREARLMAFARHPNVARLYDLYEDSDAPWAALEYVPGRSLKAELADHGALDLETIAHLLDQIAAALDHLHQKGLVHLDVKPQNLIVTPERTVKLIDFGLAQPIGQTQETIGGQAFGTAAYLAPEQACGDPVDASTDVYSLGCVVYELLTGSPPFTSGTGQEVKDDIIRAHLEQPPVPPTVKRPDLGLPVWVDEVVLRALVKQPEDRYAEATTLARLFHDGVNGVLDPVRIYEEDTPRRAPQTAAPFSTAWQPDIADSGRPIFGNQVVAAAYRAGGERLRRATVFRRRLWRAIAIVAAANLLLALALLVNHGRLPGLIAPEASLAAGHQARVAAESFRLRAEPGLGAETLTMVEGGDQLVITGDAVSADGRQWWPVSYRADGTTIQGYIAEEGIVPQESDDPALLSDLIDTIRDLV